jgi:nucleoside-diphosphate-sugar epimerase
MLLDQDHQVRVVDLGYFGLDHIDGRAELIPGDILDFDKDWLVGVEAVVHLAGLSNDPMAEFSPRLNYMLNAAGTGIVAQATKEAGIGRLIFASTCSVYGTDDQEAVDEDRPANPPYPYAISKLMAERALGCLADDDFRPIIFRKGTVVGWSPRMRFDLVTNAMVKSAVTQRTIVIHNPDLWRPLIDVEDVARAYLAALESDPSTTGVFNISTRNYGLLELGETVAATLADFGVEASLEIQSLQGLRSYRVLTDRAESAFGFRSAKTMATTVRDIMANLIANSLFHFDDPRYYNIRQLQRLVSEGVIRGDGDRPARVAALA